MGYDSVMDYTVDLSAHHDSDRRSPAHIDPELWAITQRILREDRFSEDYAEYRRREAKYGL